MQPLSTVQVRLGPVVCARLDVLVLRGDNDDDDEGRLGAAAAGFWTVAAPSFGVILLAELGDLHGLQPARRHRAGQGEQQDIKGPQ